jgi:hypothetical protein
MSIKNAVNSTTVQDARTRFQADFMRRQEELRSSNPALASLEAKLLSIGGVRVALMPDPHATEIVKRGQIFGGKGSKKARGVPHQCHANVAELWLKRRKQGFAIVTGWTLTKDGCWIQHTWGLQKGQVIETTCKQDTYFGVVLDLEESLMFCFGNASDALYAAMPAMSADQAVASACVSIFAKAKAARAEKVLDTAVPLVSPGVSGSAASPDAIVRRAS